jgi:hypothetical protein
MPDCFRLNQLYRLCYCPDFLRVLFYE